MSVASSQQDAQDMLKAVVDVVNESEEKIKMNTLDYLLKAAKEEAKSDRYKNTEFCQPSQDLTVYALVRIIERAVELFEERNSEDEEDEIDLTEGQWK